MHIPYIEKANKASKKCRYMLHSLEQAEGHFLRTFFEKSSQPGFDIHPILIIFFSGSFCTDFTKRC